MQWRFQTGSKREVMSQPVIHYLMYMLVLLLVSRPITLRVFAVLFYCETNCSVWGLLGWLVGCVRFNVPLDTF